MCSSFDTILQTLFRCKRDVRDSGARCFFASVTRDYGLNSMMKWTHRELWRQRWVPSPWSHTKVDTSAQQCSTTSHNIIMTARQLGGCTQFSSLIFHQSISWEVCSWAEVRGHRRLPRVNVRLWFMSACVRECKPDWVCDRCHLSHSYQSREALWRQLLNWSTHGRALQTSEVT